MNRVIIIFWTVRMLQYVLYMYILHITHYNADVCFLYEKYESLRSEMSFHLQRQSKNVNFSIFPWHVYLSFITSAL